MKTLRETRRFAIRAHGAQPYGPFPYSYHLRAAENVARRFGFRSRIVAKAIWLHDVIEDCKLSVSYLVLQGLDPRAVQMAWAVSDGEGATRKERKASTYEKIRTTPGAKLVKLCDRIANVEFSSSGNGDPRKFQMYKDEYADFQRELRDRTDLVLEPLWLHLDSLLCQ
jgi:(p)ppGpp synthase/HD superfamily hydrolase